MISYPNVLVPHARIQYGTAAPWQNKASPITDAITSENYKGLLGGVTNPGSAITSWNEEKGGLAGGLTALTWNVGLAGRNLSYIAFGTPGSGGSSSATFDAIGASISGTAISWTIFLSGFLNANTSAAGAHYLLSFGRSTAAPPFIGFSINPGTATMVVQRRNDANTVFTGGNIVLGTTSPFVLGIRYTGGGTNILTSKLNGAVVDNALAFGGGAQTLNRFTLGALRLNGAASGFSNYWHDRFIIVPGTALSDALYLPYETYLMRRLGL